MRRRLRCGIEEQLKGKGQKGTIMMAEEGAFRTRLLGP
jgi:hypothetical protein